MNYYECLGINKNSSKDEIKKAFRKLSLQYHPDRPNGNSDKFKQINEAYETLGDPQKKKMYDLIWRVSCAACMSNAILNCISAEISAPLEHSAYQMIPAEKHQ